MPVLLAGGCRVMGLREGDPLRRENLGIWRHVGRETGAKAISLRVLEIETGTSPALRNSSGEEALFVLEGEGTVFLDGWPHRVGAETGIYLPSGVSLAIENAGKAPLTLLGAQCPDPGPSVTFEAPLGKPSGGSPPAPPVRFQDRETQVAGDGRSFRVLLDERVGSSRVTQFLGAIPPGRAPDHYHDYEEVLCILEGVGRMWAGGASAPLLPGSCVFLPRGQAHCLENTESGELRLVGVFYPAGSPAVRYSPD